MENNNKAIEIVDETIKNLEIIAEQQNQSIREIMDDLKKLADLLSPRHCAECGKEFEPEHYCKATSAQR